MPTVPTYKICPGRPIEAIVETSDGGRALVAGTLDAVPACSTGGTAFRIVVAAARVEVLLAAEQAS